MEQIQQISRIGAVPDNGEVTHNIDPVALGKVVGMYFQTLTAIGLPDDAALALAKALHEKCLEAPKTVAKERG